MTPAEAERELQRIVRVLAGDDLLHSMARMNPWALGGVLSFGGRIQLERRRDECLKLLPQDDTADG